MLYQLLFARRRSLRPNILFLLPAVDDVTPGLLSNALCVSESSDGTLIQVLHSRAQALDGIRQSRNTPAQKVGLSDLVAQSCMPETSDRAVTELRRNEAADLGRRIIAAGGIDAAQYLPEYVQYGFYIDTENAHGYGCLGVLSPEGCEFHVVHSKDELRRLLHEHRLAARRSRVYQAAQQQILVSTLPEVSGLPSWKIDGFAAFAVMNILAVHVITSSAPRN